MKQSVPPGLAHLHEELTALARDGLLRVRPMARDPDRVSYCSNDYLGLATGGGPATPAGAGASRLVSGEHVEHARLEEALAAWVGTETALLFTSGYAANVGVVPALASHPDDLIVSDALNHASLVDGCRLARGQTVVVPHLDVDAVRTALRARRARHAWVLTESYFSMDADSPDLAALREVCDELGAALVVDEAHAFGVLGPDGRGLLAAADVKADVTVGTFGKAFGGAGAFVAGCAPLTSWLWNRARSFVFSTGLSPALATAGREALETIRSSPELRARTAERAAQLRQGLQHLGFATLGYGHIVPWVLGEANEAVRVADALRARGFAVQAIRPPSVPNGTARIRFTASARQRPEDIDALLDAIRRVAR